jgi:hypothetical protein
MVYTFLVRDRIGVLDIRIDLTVVFGQAVPMEVMNLCHPQLLHK